MQNVKKILVSVVIIPLIISAMFSSSNFVSAHGNDSTPIQIFTATEYMNGIVFGHGPVGDVLFGGENPKEPTIQEEVFMKEFSAYMESEHQDALNELKNAILSQDPNATMETLKVISANLNQYVEDNDYSFLPPNSGVSPRCGPTICGLIVVAAAHQYVGVTYAVVGGAVVYLTVGTWGPGKKSINNPEQAIVHVLDSLA